MTTKMETNITATTSDVESDDMLITRNKVQRFINFQLQFTETINLYYWRIILTSSVFKSLLKTIIGLINERFGQP